MAFFDIKSQIAIYIQIRTLHSGKQISHSKTAQNLSLIILVIKGINLIIQSLDSNYIQEMDVGGSI